MVKNVVKLDSDNLIVAYKFLKKSGLVRKFYCYSFSETEGVNYPDPDTGDIREFCEPIDTENHRWTLSVIEAHSMVDCYIEKLRVNLLMLK